MDILNEVSVIFSVKNASDNVYLVGNCENLGNWIPLHGIKLTKSSSMHTSIIPIKLLKNTTIEYKYVSIINEQETWESVENRKITPLSNLCIIDAFNSPISSIDYCQKKFEKIRRNSSELKFEKMQVKDRAVIIVSMHLPVCITKNHGEWEVVSNNSSWHSQLYDVACKNLNFLWIGYPGMIVPQEDYGEVTQIFSRYQCIPVFVPEDTLKFHSGYCENILFNILHNIVDLRNETLCNYHIQQWEGYKMLNIMFSEALFNVFSGQMVWIHGSELIVLPSLLSKKIKDPVNIGFYMHRPFPSSEVFKVLPQNVTLLNALCSCDVIGFQIFEHASHFIGTCKRILGIESSTSKEGYINLNYFGRGISIFIGHVGTMPKKILEIQEKSEYQIVFDVLKKQYKGKIMILSIDNVTPIAGLTLKLAAIENIYKFAKSNKKPIVFVQILIPNPDFSSICSNIIGISHEINAKTSSNYIEVIVKQLTVYERYAYMKVSKGLLLSTIREGLGLLPFEYILLNSFKTFGIVISEFSGASRALCSPYKVNPFDINALESVLLQLIRKTPMTATVEKDLAYMNTKTTELWASDFIAQMNFSVKNTEKYQYVSIGMGDTLRMMAIAKDFIKLDEYKVLSAYRESANRVIFLDVEGTLLSFLKEVDSFTPSDKILAALEELCSDPKNTVVLITGREKETLSKWFGSVKKLIIAAEYGAFLKMYSDDWESFYNTTGDWKEHSKTIIESHVERTEGSFIIVKETSVMFNYREAECGFGKWQARDLVSHLESSLKLKDCEVVEGIGYVEIRPRGIDKGTTIYRVLQRVNERKGQVDFLITIGDDASDEKMFKMVKLLKKRGSQLLSQSIQSFTCTFGMKPSKAMYYFLSADEILKLMELLSASGGGKKSLSSANLFARRSHHHFTAINVNTYMKTRKNHDSEDMSSLLSPK